MPDFHVTKPEFVLGGYLLGSDHLASVSFVLGSRELQADLYAKNDLELLIFLLQLQVLGLELCVTIPRTLSARYGTEGFVPARQILYKLIHIPSCYHLF